MTEMTTPKLRWRTRIPFRTLSFGISKLFRISCFVLHASLTGVPFVLIFLLSPALGIRFANRFREPIMDKQQQHRQKRYAGAKQARPYEENHLSRNAWRAVRFFRKTPRTEEAFYLRFQLLCARKRRQLKDCWKLADDWALYRRLCRFWGVGRRVTRADRAEQGHWDLDERQLRLPFAEEEAA